MKLKCRQFIEYKIRTFVWENCTENVHQKLVSDPFLILVNNSKQPLYARNYFKDTIKVYFSYGHKFF